jgi:hypothetical protein
MLFRLALALRRTIAELSMPGVLSHAEYLDWIEYYRQEPWGEERADLRAGTISAVIANAYTLWNGGEAKHKPSDFMPYLNRPAVVETVEEQILTDEELAAWADATIYGFAPEPNVEEA